MTEAMPETTEANEKFDLDSYEPKQMARAAFIAFYLMVFFGIALILLMVYLGFGAGPPNPNFTAYPHIMD